MTDRFSTLTVVLEKDTREDDAEALINAIRMLRGVLTVAGDVANAGDFLAQERARWEIEGKIFAALRPNK